jgi:hypothetical protein
MDKKVKKVLLKSLGLNILAGGIGMLILLVLPGDAKLTWGFLLLIIAAVSLLIQLITAIVYINNAEKKEIGQGMLISVGIILLIGVAACSPFWF